MITFNGIDLSNYLTVNEVSGRNLAPHSVDTVSVTGRDGDFYVRSTRRPREIKVVFTLLSKDETELRSIFDYLNDVFYVTEPVPIVFSDEPSMTYYGVPAGVSEDRDFVRWSQGSITFVCPDPFKYGPEKTLYFPSDMVSIPNEGTAEADPIFELTAKEKTTFATVSNQDDEYMLIGKLADDDVQEVDTRTSVFYENGSTLDTWTHTSERRMVSHDRNIDGLNGTMGTDGAGIRIESRGPTTNKQNGPAVFKELPNAVQDFEIESTFDIISRREIENWRMMIYFLDENMNNIGHMGIKDNSRAYKRRVALSQLGQHQQGVSLIGDSSYIENSARDTTLFYLRFRREGRRFTVYIAHWRNQRHETVWEASYNDVNNEFQGRLKYITLFIGRFQDRVNPNRARINSVEVFELSQTTEDQTPYILRPGDVVTFDHKNDDVLVNGEARNDLLNFGASFFKLKRGENLLSVTPEGAFDVSMNYREKFR